MNNILVLDCTLRDGGYVNNNCFGYQNIEKIIQALNESKVDIIECGYIKDTSVDYSKDITEYKSFESFHEEQGQNLNKNREYALMILGEEYDIDNLPMSTSNRNIVRMTFHKKSVEKAIKYAEIIKEKGYKLFVQPTTIMRYSTREIIHLLKEINKIKPYCVSVVDTFGEMRRKDVLHAAEIFNKYLDKDIAIGFHAHNNLQLAFSNAIAFIDVLHKKRTVIVDTSIYGMGRGAGNLPTELLTNYLNENYNKKYKINSILNIADSIIKNIKVENNWGYSLEYYLSAINSIHPSYVINFMNRQTLNTIDINNLLNSISYDKKSEYNKEYANELYNSYNDKEINDKKSYDELKKVVNNKNVLLIGPGVSITKHKKQIEKYINDKNVISIAVNNKLMYNTDYIFVSNKKRYEMLNKEDKDKIIITSNIKSVSENEIIFNYQKSLSRKVGISDNSLLILLNILSKVTKEVILAGFDGFSLNLDKNFYDSNIKFVLDKNYVKDLNKFIEKNINEYKKKMSIITITPSKYFKEATK